MTHSTKADRHNAVNTLLRVANAILETVFEAGPQGAPAGYLYAAVMHLMSLEHFERIMGALVIAGKVRKQGHVYFACGTKLKYDPHND